MESKVKGAICSLQEDVKNHINILSLTSWNTQLIINLVIMASCIGCFLRRSIVWKMCLLTSSYWEIYFFVWKSEPCRLSPPVWADPRLLCWERERTAFLSPSSASALSSAVPVPIHLPWLPGKHTKWLKREELEIQWKEGNEKPGKKEESWIRCVCSERWRSALKQTLKHLLKSSGSFSFALIGIGLDLWYGRCFW